jgi:hypothetical protein
MTDSAADDGAARRAEEKEARGWRELADSIEACWRSRFGEPSTVAKADIARIRRGNP